MADSKLSAFTITTSLGTTDFIPAIKAGANRIITWGSVLAQANTWGGVNTFNGTLGVGGAPSTSFMDSGCTVFQTRTTAPSSATVGLLQHLYYALTPVDNTTVQTAVLGDIQVNGTGTQGAGHSVAGIFRATDSTGTAGQFSGLEGKRVCLGSSDAGQAVWGIVDYNMASATGRTAVGFRSWAEFFNGSTTNNVTSGGFVGYYAQQPGTAGNQGDSTKWYSLVGEQNFKLQTGGLIASYTGSTPALGTTASTYIGMLHNGTDGVLATVGAGNLQLGSAGGFLIAQTGVGLVPLTSGGACGLSSNYWAFTGTYASSDGTAGMSTTTTVAAIGVKTITIKNGLITSIA